MIQHAATDNSFVGRSTELEELSARLADPACRLLTIVGPGGAGKTRLAVELMARHAAAYDTAATVWLQPLLHAELIASAIADALGLTLRGAEEPLQQVANHLRGQHILLLLDNFEHLMPGADTVIELLDAAPGLQILVTSREALNLRQEWRYPLHGLDVPAGEDNTDGYSAVELFELRARRARPGFRLDGSEADVIRICQLTEGLPLAIELAAAWMQVLDAHEIAAEIQRSVDFLSTQQRDVPDRHRTMEAVFDQSWGLLNEGEQDVFMRLAVFHGGFDRAAAQQIAGASLVALSALVDKSLLRRDAGGRYHVHELLRQYAAERLARTPQTEADTHDAHARYYAMLLDALHEDILGGDQQGADDQIEAELDNVRAAWDWMCSQRLHDEIARSAHVLNMYYEHRSRYRESARAARQAVEAFDSTGGEETAGTLAALLTLEGWAHVRLGRLDAARKTFQQAQALYESTKLPLVDAFASDPLAGLGVLAMIDGAYEEAARMGEQALARAREAADSGQQALARYVLADAALAQGRHRDAWQHAEEAYRQTMARGDRWFAAYVLSQMGMAARDREDYAAAEQRFTASYQLRQSFNDTAGMGVALNHLGRTVLMQGDAERAGALFQRSLALYRQTGDRGGLATAYEGLGEAHCLAGDTEAARTAFRSALAIAVEQQFTTHGLSALTGVGRLLYRAGRPERARDVLSSAAAHPASSHEIVRRAQSVLAEFGDAPIEPDPDRTLEMLLRAVLVELDTITGLRSAAPLGVGEQGLVEPLTPRELEVLALMAEGQTNRQIADELILSVGTVKYYTSQIYGKLGVQNRTEAAAHARALGLLA